MRSLITVLVLSVFAIGAFSFKADTALAQNTGQCNAIAGEALGVVHRINNGEELCGELNAIFGEFVVAGCTPLLAEGELFLNAAVGQYELACSTFVDPCGADPEVLNDEFGICPFFD